MTDAVALREAVEVARLAPSVHNTQPWRWRVSDDALELRAERSRQLTVADPDGLLLTVSCGAALHHARLALDAAGWEAEVERVPDPADPDLLARVTVTGQGEPDSRAAQLVAAARHRHTDRRPVDDRPLPMSVLASVTAAVAAEDIGFYLLHADDVVELTVAVDNADRAELSEHEYQIEIAAWTGGDRLDGTGVPASAIPDHDPQTQVPGRYLGQPGTLPVDASHDAAARYAILHGDSDSQQCRLRAGEGLSAGWLSAMLQGVSVLPISGPVEVVATRRMLRRLLSDLGYPYLALRLGYPAAEAPPPLPTPRLPVEAILDGA
jgi:nitroreductase